MKKIIILITCLIGTVIYAQNDKKTSLDKRRFEIIDKSLFDCIYEYKIEHETTEGEEISETYNTILQVGSSVAKFWDYSTFTRDSVVYMANDSSEKIKKEYENRLLRQIYFFDATIFQNLPKGKMTVDDVITPNLYTYIEDTDIFEWQLLQDTLTVCGNLCYKAITSYGGREWIEIGRAHV